VKINSIKTENLLNNGNIFQLMKIDDKDRTIIQELIKNSNQTTHQLSKKTKFPITTVHNRIKKLEKMGVIVNYTVNLDYKQLGRPILAVIGVTINYHARDQKIKQTDVAQQIRKIDGVYEVAIMTGGADILVKILAKDIDDLNDIVTEQMRNIDGVDKTQTAIVLKTV